MPLLKVLLTPEEKRQRVKELKHQYYIENRDRLLEYQSKYKASLETTYTPSQKKRYKNINRNSKLKTLKT